MEKSPAVKTIMEAAREIKVCYEADVVVVGGGPGGIGSAIAAARNGAKTVLIERYGHLGGMASGGLVNIIPNLSDISGKQHIAGLCQELIDRMDARGAADFPRKEDWGSTDRKLVDRYLDSGLSWFYIRNDLNINKQRVLYTALVDPEVLKDELNSMVVDAGVKLYLHSWGAAAIMEENTVKGVIFESKSGRQAILGQVVIDSSGDGDIFLSAGAEFDGKIKPGSRLENLALAFWLVNVDIRKADDFKASQPEKYAELMQELAGLGGFTHYFKDLLKDQDNVVWFHPFFPSPDQKDVEELTRVDVTARRRVLITYEFLKKHIPGFEKSFIMLTAPQLGTQGGRRVIGEYILTEKDMISDEIFDDTIAVFANNDNAEISAKHPSICIPYRCLVPRRIEGLLVACRAFSSEDSVNTHFNLVPHCICLGQAAGTAAALATKNGVIPRDVSYTAMQKRLIGQGVLLPDELRVKTETETVDVS